MFSKRTWTTTNKHGGPVVYRRHCPAASGMACCPVKPGCRHFPQPPPLPPQLPACEQKEHEGAHIEN